MPKPKPKHITWCCPNCGHEKRCNIQVPVPVITGHLEELNDQQLREQARDINAETLRRGYRLSRWLKNL